MLGLKFSDDSNEERWAGQQVKVGAYYKPWKNRFVELGLSYNVPDAKKDNTLFEGDTVDVQGRIQTDVLFSRTSIFLWTSHSLWGEFQILSFESNSQGEASMTHDYRGIVKRISLGLNYAPLPLVHVTAEVTQGQCELKFKKITVNEPTNLTNDELAQKYQKLANYESISVMLGARIFI